MKKTIMLIALTFVFCLGLFNLRGYVALLRERGVQRECRDIANVTFLTFIPCPQGFSDNGTSIHEWLDHCDLLTRAAVELAVERVNQNENVLNNSLLRVTPLYDVINSVGTKDLPTVSHLYR